MQKKKSFSWKKALTPLERDHALAKIGPWISFSPLKSPNSLGEKKISRLTTIDPKLIQVLDFLFVRIKFVDSFPHTYHAILTLAEEIHQGSYGHILEELTREEQEIAYSDRILFALLCHYQAFHGSLKEEFFFPIQNFPNASEWFSHARRLSTHQFGTMLVGEKLNPKDQHWKEMTLMFFHVTEISRFPWNQISHLYRQALDYFHYLSSATVKLILSDPKQPEVWKKAAAYCLKLPVSLDQQQAWSEVANFLEFRSEGDALLELLTIAPTNAQELLIRHWLDLQYRQGTEHAIHKEEWACIKKAISALPQEKAERLVRIASLTCARKKDYDKAFEIIGLSTKEERDLLYLAILDICTKHGDFEQAERMLNLLSEHDTRQEAIQKLLDSLIRADRSEEANKIIEGLPVPDERQAAVRAISSSQRLWQRQRRVMRSSLLARHVV